MSITWTPEDMLPRSFHSFHHEGVLLGYAPLTGRGVKWIPRYARWNPITPGNTSGGNTRVGINGSQQQWHCIVAQHFINGGVPIPREFYVDHRKPVTGKAAQDRLDNLRIMSHSENAQNREKAQHRKTGSSKYAGVYWDSHVGKWRVRVRNASQGTRQNLGLFTDEREAAEAYVNFCQQHGLACGPAIEALKLDETDYRQFN